jgi:hypothetical protein
MQRRLMIFPKIASARLVRPHMANIGDLEKEDSIEQEQRMQQLFRRKAEEGEGMAMIAYALMVVADSNRSIAIASAIGKKLPSWSEA